MVKASTENAIQNMITINEKRTKNIVIHTLQIISENINASSNQSLKCITTWPGTNMENGRQQSDTELIKVDSVNTACKFMA